jgi:hypothetical protein
LQKEAGDDPASQTEHAYLVALGRKPFPSELAETVPVVREHGAAALCRALFNCNEFLFLP